MTPYNSDLVAVTIQQLQTPSRCQVPPHNRPLAAEETGSEVPALMLPSNPHSLACWVNGEPGDRPSAHHSSLLQASRHSACSPWRRAAPGVCPAVINCLAGAGGGVGVAAGTVEL